MRNITFFATVALSCCGSSSSFAQIEMIGSGQPTLAPRFVSDQNALVDLEPQAFGTAGSRDAIANPFDYFADELPTDPISQDELQTKEDSADASDSQHGSSSHSVGDHRHSVVDTILEQAALGLVANASTSPIYWGGAPQTPNPVAQWLLREQCVQGLWDGYHEQRAAECSLMWAHLTGYGHCRRGTVAIAGPCAICEPANPRNRYTEHLLPASPQGSACGQALNCDGCAQLAPLPPVPVVPQLQNPTTQTDNGSGAVRNVASMPMTLVR